MTSILSDQYKLYVEARTNSEKLVVVNRLEMYVDEFTFDTSDSDLCHTASARELLGRFHFELGNAERAEQNFKRSLDTYERIGLSMQAAQVAIQLAMFYLTKDRQHEADEMLSFYASRQLEHFGEDHFQSKNAIEMQAAVTDKKDLPTVAASSLYPDSLRTSR